MRRIFIIFLALFLGAMIAHAAERDFSVVLDISQLDPGERAKMEMIFKGVEDLPQPSAPSVKGLKFRYRGSARGFDTSGGDMVDTITFKFDIDALEPGTYRIGPVRFKYNGDIYTSNEAVLNVGAKAEGASVSSSGKRNDLEGHIFLRVNIPDKAYVNQKIPVAVRFITDWLDVEELNIYEAPNKRYIDREYVQGKSSLARDGGTKYAVLLFEKWIFVPESGEMEFGPVFAGAEIAKPRADLLNPNKAFYDAYIGRADSRSFATEAGPFKVNILPLPSQGRPETFKGAVGSFDVSFSLDTGSGLKVGDIVTVTSRITGSGNFDTVSAPVVTADDKFSVYDPAVERGPDMITVKQSMKIKSQQVSKVPDITFSFFDPYKAEYQSIVENDLEITMAAPKRSEESAKLSKPVAGVAVVQEPISVKDEELGKGIIYLKNTPGRLTSGDPFKIARGVFMFFTVFPFFMAGISVIVEKRLNLLRSDTAYACWIEGIKVSKEGLSKARKLSGGKDPYTFYTHVFQFMQRYFAKRFAVEPGGITAEMALGMMLPDTCTDEMKEKVRSVFKDSYIARYASAELTKNDMKKTLKDLKEIINYLDGKRKI